MPLCDTSGSMIAMIQLADKKGGYVQGWGCRVGVRVGVRVGELMKSRLPIQPL